MSSNFELSKLKTKQKALNAQLKKIMKALLFKGRRALATQEEDGRSGHQCWVCNPGTQKAETVGPQGQTG